MILRCSKCKQEKDETNFFRSRNTRTGFGNQCKSCFTEYYYANKKRLLKYRLEHKKQARRKRGLKKKQSFLKQRLDATGLLKCSRCKEEKNAEVGFYKCKSSSTGFQQYCKDCRVEIHKDYYAKNKDRLLLLDKEYRTKNRIILTAKAVEREHTNIQRRLSQRLRGRLRSVIKKNLKSGSAIRDLGCTVLHLKDYLESKFQIGMTWDNWGHGKGKWNIDHKVPLSAFNLEDRQHVLLACHYMNLQPMWFEENMSKSNNY